MPLDRSMAVGDMIGEIVRSYKKRRKIGPTKPRSMSHAKEIAAAIAYNVKRKRH